MTEEGNEEEKQTNTHQEGFLCLVQGGGGTGFSGESVCVRVCVRVQYLCVCLAVLAVIGGSIGAVRRCGGCRSAVSEGAGALGGDGSSWSDVDP